MMELGNGVYFKINRFYHWIFGYECKACHGLGLIVILNGCSAKCPTCDGKGRLRL